MKTGIRAFLHLLWRRLVFWVGDIRRLSHFPWLTWDVHEHRVRHEEIMAALPQLRYGDIGLHRDAGYLSNLAIPGFMKHAWIFTEDGPSPMIMEAVSEGVVHRSAIYPMHSDFTVILRPANVSERDRKGACLKAKRALGAHYDTAFLFNIEEELRYYGGSQLDEARRELLALQAAPKRYDMAFSCTELVSFCWWHRREQLGIHRSMHQGKFSVIADDFFNDHWDIVWMSDSVTVEAARTLKAPEKAVEKIRAWRGRFRI